MKKKQENNQEKKDIVLLPSHIMVYNFIKSYIDEKLYAPELLEIQAGVGLTDRQCFRLISDLIALGALSKVKNKRRGLKLERRLEEILSAKK